MKFNRTLIATTLTAAAFFGLSTAADATLYVRVPVAPNAKISNGGVPSAQGQESTGDHDGSGTPPVSVPVTVQLSEGPADVSGSVPPGVYCSSDDISGAPYNLISFSQYGGSSPVTATKTISYRCFNSTSTPYSMHLTASVPASGKLQCYSYTSLPATLCGQLTYSVEGNAAADFVVPAHNNYNGTITVTATVPAGQTVTTAKDAGYSAMSQVTFSY